MRARRGFFPRRRTLAPGGVALVALLAAAGCGGGSGTSTHPRPDRPAPAPRTAPRLAPRAAAGATVLLSFHGTTAPPYVLRILRRREAAGVFLTPENVASAAGLRALTAALRRAGGPGTLVAVDQEGGSAGTVPGVGPALPQPDAGPPAAVRAAARAAARVLRADGVSIVLGPVADLPDGPGAFIGPRAYAGGARAVAARVAAAVRGYAEGGVLATLKHFPGLGAARRSTDDAPAALPAPASLAPFAAGIRAGAPLVMAGHGRYPALDATAPASRSPRILGGLLRGRLGFRGVVITDSMEARASLDGTTLERAATGAIRAGADLLLLTGPGSWIRVHRALTAEARRSPAFARRLGAAAARITLLRSALNP